MTTMVHPAKRKASKEKESADGKKKTNNEVSVASKKHEKSTQNPCTKK